MHWKETSAGWRLHTADGRIHTCPNYQRRSLATASEQARSLQENEARLAKIAEQIMTTITWEE